jgi:hypothetical protein
MAGRYNAVDLLSRDDAGLVGFGGVYVLERSSRPPAPFVDHSRALIPADAIAPIALIDLAPVIRLSGNFEQPRRAHAAANAERPQDSNFAFADRVLWVRV